MAPGIEVGLGPGPTVLDGHPAPLPKKGGTAPQFWAHFYCGQTAGCTKMQLGMEGCLGPGHIVLDGNPAPPTKGAQTPHFPHFGPYLLCPNGRMHQDAN